MMVDDEDKSDSTSSPLNRTETKFFYENCIFLQKNLVN